MDERPKAPVGNETENLVDEARARSTLDGSIGPMGTVPDHKLFGDLASALEAALRTRTPVPGPNLSPVATVSEDDREAIIGMLLTDDRQEEISLAEARSIVSEVVDRPATARYWEDLIERKSRLADAIVALIACRTSAQSSRDGEALRDHIADLLHKLATGTTTIATCPPTWTGHWREWYRSEADSLLAGDSTGRAEAATEGDPGRTRRHDESVMRDACSDGGI